MVFDDKNKSVKDCNELIKHYEEIIWLCSREIKKLRKNIKDLDKKGKVKG